jgi:HEAT repeat protein
MGKYDRVRERTGWGVPGACDTSRSEAEVDELIALTHDADPRTRKIALTNLCPCHVRANVPAAWDRVLAMTDDADPIVRRAVVHMLADGSPRELVTQVAEALDGLRNDSDRVVRRDVRRILASYRRTGRVNIL